MGSSAFSVYFNTARGVVQSIEWDSPIDGSTEQPKTDSYSNSKYRYRVNFPTNLISEGEPDAHDGQRFHSRDERFKMTVWGRFNVLGATLAGTLEEAIESNQQEQPLKITYKVLNSGWFVYSGTVDNRIFYRKTVFEDDTFKTIELEYPVAEKVALDPTVKAILASFQTWRGGGSELYH